MALHTSSPNTDTFARLHAAHTALQLKPINYEPFHALAIQHLSFLPTPSTALLPSNALESATASFISQYGGHLWPSYAPYRTHLIDGIGSFKLKSKALLSFPRDAMPKTNDVQKAKEKGGEGGQAELVSKTKLGKLVGKYLVIVVEEGFVGTHPKRATFDDEVVGKVLQAVLGNLDWSVLRIEIENLESGAENAQPRSGHSPVETANAAADAAPSPGAPTSHPSADTTPDTDAPSPSADAHFGVDVHPQIRECEIVCLDMPTADTTPSPDAATKRSSAGISPAIGALSPDITTPSPGADADFGVSVHPPPPLCEVEGLEQDEQKWKDWAQEMKRERKRKDSVGRVEEWIEGIKLGQGWCG